MASLQLLQSFHDTGALPERFLAMKATSTLLWVKRGGFQWVKFWEKAPAPSFLSPLKLKAELLPLQGRVFWHEVTFFPLLAAGLQCLSSFRRLFSTGNGMGLMSFPSAESERLKIVFLVSIYLQIWGAASFLHSLGGIYNEKHVTIKELPLTDCLQASHPLAHC